MQDSQMYQKVYTFLYLSMNKYEIYVEKYALVFYLFQYEKKDAFFIYKLREFSALVRV